MWKKAIIFLVVILKVEIAISEQTIKAVLATNEGVKLFINEIMFSTSHDWVEVYCVDDGNSGNGVEIKGFYFDDLDSDEDKIIGSCTIKTGEFLLLHYGIEGQDETFGSNGKINIFTDNKFITSTTDQMVIYNSVDEIIDGVCWANDTPPSNEEEDRNKLINAGKWQGEAIDSTNVLEGQSIARVSNRDTETKNDWYVASVPTLGLPNNMTSQAAKSPEIKVVKITNQTFAPQESKKPTIIYSLSKASQVSLRIYDIRGRLVKRLIEQEYKVAKEENIISWDGRDEDGNLLPIGVYICYLEAVGDGGASSDKVTLILAKKL
ncbi:MAG: FlgD immunoglobulin-like domain containing protein [bacterium]